MLPIPLQGNEYSRQATSTQVFHAALQRLAGTTTGQITDVPGIFQNKSEHQTSEMCLENQHGQQCQQPTMTHTIKYLFWSK